MEVGFVDNSNEAKITRLEGVVEGLNAKLASVTPQPAPVKPDPKAARALEVERQKTLADLRHRLDARQVHLGKIDAAAKALSELVLAERAARHGIITAHSADIEKELRRELMNDGGVVAALQRLVGETMRPHTGHSQPSLAILGKRQRDMILMRVNAADDLSDVLA